MEYFSSSSVFRIDIESAEGRNAAKIAIQKFVGHIPAITQTEAKMEMRSPYVRVNMAFFNAIQSNGPGTLYATECWSPSAP